MKKSDLLQKIAQLTDLDTEPIPGRPLIEIRGNSSVLIENHCGIATYSNNSVTVKTKTGCICITGYNLYLSKMNSEQLQICGRIENLCLRGRG